MKAKGRMAISRTNSTRGPDMIRMTVTDNKSGEQFLEIRLSLEDFSRVVTGMMLDIDMDLRHENLGKTREHKYEDVPFDRLSATDEEVDEALAHFEVFGWKADRSDMTNHHRRVGRFAQRVSFTRHV